MATTPIWVSYQDVDTNKGEVERMASTEHESKRTRRVDNAVVTSNDEPHVDYVGYYMDGLMFTTNIAGVHDKAVIPRSNYYYQFSAGWEGDYKVTSGTIQGMRDAVLGMKVGENKTIICPPEKAYGFNNTVKPHFSGRTLMFLIFVLYIDDVSTTDTDDDGYGDDADYFPTSNSIHYQDYDHDGMPDSKYPEIGGLDFFSSNSYEWRDFDGDGIPDGQEPDIDGDGILNQNDVFEYDVNEWNDTDNDGMGDNRDWDIDGDGYFNGFDDLPYESTQVNDTDGDGYGDNPNGNDPDKFPDDPAAAVDTDGDGYPDNWIQGKTQVDSTTGITHSDAFPDDIAASKDTDSDGYPDSWNTGKSEQDSTSNPKLRLDDLKDDPAASLDTDKDGYPD